MADTNASASKAHPGALVCDLFFFRPLSQVSALGGSEKLRPVFVTNGTSLPNWNHTVPKLQTTHAPALC